ncbi:acyl-CoA thioesterase [Murinocardiopsis flavida]|uniref:Acyl-CoA thioesterase n=1 Tax=Murinocardiopsis flavida TaxID=645275 RepID=A0A2P8DMV6_9ACTN|nr:hydroxyphenylacetyl-CoA thioesterase PaaI [Murinocardiopsis flavida]PSK98547.1 acyl-CoA thioesterase [Murinocardiopsis flavida]
MYQPPHNGADPQRTAEESVAAMMAADVSAGPLGIDVDRVAPGRARATMRVTPAMVNGHGLCHGGYVFLIADTAFAAACNTYGVATVAAGADITFVAAARAGDLLTAHATERTRYGRSGLYDATVTRAAASAGPDEVIAEFRGRSRALPAARR